VTLLLPETKHLRSAPLSVVTKVLDAPKGITEQIVSVSGNRDASGDVVLPGATTYGLEIVNPKGVWSHDWSTPIAKSLDARELLPGDSFLAKVAPTLAEKGLGGMYVKSQYNLETQAGQEAFSNVKFFEDEQEYSVGYEIIANAWVGGSSKAAGQQHLAKAKEIASAHGIKLDDYEDSADRSQLIVKWIVYEWSPVLFGMNRDTVHLSAKDAQHRERITVFASKLWLDDADAFPGTLEALQDAVGDAVEQFGADNAPQGDGMGWDYTCAVATWPNSVIAYHERGGFAGEDPVEEYLQFPYVQTADGEIALGQPTPVEISVSVGPGKTLGDLKHHKGRPAGQYDPMRDLEEALAWVLDGGDGAKALAGEKVGRAIARRNVERLERARDAIQELIAETTAESPEEEIEVPDGEKARGDAPPHAYRDSGDGTCAMCGLTHPGHDDKYGTSTLEGGLEMDPMVVDIMRWELMKAKAPR
jgi:hypothetical protein